MPVVSETSMPIVSETSIPFVSETSMPVVEASACPSNATNATCAANTSEPEPFLGAAADGMRAQLALVLGGCALAGVLSLVF